MIRVGLKLLNTITIRGYVYFQGSKFEVWSAWNPLYDCIQSIPIQSQKSLGIFGDGDLIDGKRQMKINFGGNKMSTNLLDETVEF